MSKYLRSLLLMTLLSSCAKPLPPTTPASIRHCQVHQYTPPPKVPAVPCGDQVCLTIAAVKALAVWIASMKETGDSLAACSLVDEVP